MKNSSPEDFSRFLDDHPPSRKENLIEECKKLDVSIFIDDSSETSSGVYSELRAVVSEAELDRRLMAKKALISASQSKYIAIISMGVSLIALAKSFF